MKSKILLLSTAIITLLFFSCNNQSYEKKIIGTWQIDTVYYENADSVLKLFGQYVVNKYKERVGALQDSLNKLNSKEKLTQIDSLYLLTYQSELQKSQQIVSYYSNFDNFKKDILANAQQAKGLEYTFEKDSTLIVPDAPVKGKWYIKGKTLNLKIGDFQVSADIIKLTNKQLIFKTSQDIDSTLVITAYYELHKVKHPKKTQTTMPQPSQNIHPQQQQQQPSAKQTNASKN